MSFARLQQQANAYSGFAERGQEQLANFDRDSLMVQGQQAAYRQGHQVMERMVGQEVLQGLERGLPSLYKGGKAAVDRARGLPTTQAEATRRAQAARRPNQPPGEDENLPQGREEPPAAPSYEDALRDAATEGEAAEGSGLPSIFGNSQARAAANRIRRPGGAPDQEGDLEPMGDDGAGNRIRNTAPEPDDAGEAADEAEEATARITKPTADQARRIAGDDVKDAGDDILDDLEKDTGADALENFKSTPQPNSGDIARPTRSVPEPPGTDPTDAYDSQGRSRPPPERPTREAPEAPGDEGEDSFNRELPQDDIQRPTREAPEAPGEEGEEGEAAEAAEAGEDATARATQPSADEARQLAGDENDKPPAYEDDAGDADEAVKDASNVDKDLGKAANVGEDIEKAEVSLAPEEEVASAIPGAGEILEGVLAIGGAIAGGVEAAKASSDSAPKQLQGAVAPQLAFSSAPVIDSDDYHNR